MFAPCYNYKKCLKMCSLKNILSPSEADKKRKKIKKALFRVK